MLSKAKLSRKSVPALRREFDEVLNGAMNVGEAEALGPYIDRMTQIRDAVRARHHSETLLRQRVLYPHLVWMSRAVVHQRNRRVAR